MMSAAELDRALQRLEDQSTRLRAVSRHNPHVFLEDKQELTRAIRELRTVVKAPVARVLPDLAAIRPGTRTIGRREVVVERRRA